MTDQATETEMPSVAAADVDERSAPKNVAGGTRRAMIVGALAGLVIGAAATFAGFAVGDSDDAGNRMPMDRMTRMEISGEMHRMMSDHAAMLDDMRDTMSPAMRKAMDKDPMMQMMMSGSMHDMLKEHEAATKSSHRAP